MQKQHANVSFHDVTQAELSPLGHTIVSKMTTNVAIYPAPPVTMAALNGLLSAWDLIIGKAEYAGRTGDLKNARTALETGLNTNGIYVNGIAKGDLAMLEKSGYTISKLHAPVGDLLPPVSVTVTNGVAPATFDFNIAVVPNAKGYLVAYTLMSNVVTDPNLWTIMWSAKHTNTFGGFAPNIQYKFAACAVGASNIVFWKNSAENLYAR